MKWFLGIVCAACSFLLGNLNGMLIVLVVLMAVDMLTGIIAAGISGTISSRVGLVGIARKFIILAIVAIANLIDVYAGLGAHLRDVSIIFYMVNEFISVTENCGKIGVPMPAAIKRALDSMNAEGGADNGQKASDSE